MNDRLPHQSIVLAVTWAAIFGYAVFSIWVFGLSGDAALKGDVMGTWKSFAVLAFGFWLGSSSGGKSKPAPEPVKDDPTRV